jgi:hypothetical protein
VYVYRSRLKCLDPCRAGVCCTREWPLLQKISVRDMVCGLSPYTPHATPFKCSMDPHFGYLPPHRFGHSVSITSDSGTIAIGELHDRSSLQNTHLNNNNNNNNHNNNNGHNRSAALKMQESHAYVLRVTTDSVGGVDTRLSYIPDQILTTWDRPASAPDGDEGYENIIDTRIARIVTGVTI